MCAPRMLRVPLLSKTLAKTRHSRVRLRLERLDERITPAGDNVWIAPAPGPGLWSVAANWSLGHTPGDQADRLHFGNGQFGYGTATNSEDDIDNAFAEEIDTAGYAGSTITIQADKNLTVLQDFIVEPNVNLIMNNGDNIYVGNNFYFGGNVETNGEVNIDAGEIVQPEWGLWIIRGHTTVYGSIWHGGTITFDPSVPGSLLEVFGNFTQLPTGNLIAVGGGLNVHGNAIFSGFSRFNAPWLSFENPAVINTGGRWDIFGTGSINGTVNNEAGTIWFDPNSDTSVWITGDYRQGYLGTLEMSFNGNFMGVQGSAFLDGTFHATVSPAWNNETSIPWEYAFIIAWEGGFGDFAVKTYPSLPEGWYWELTGGWVDMSGTPWYMFIPRRV